VGFWDRLGKIVVSPAVGAASAVWGTARAGAGLAVDLVSAPWNDEEDYNGFVHTLWQRSLARGADTLNAAFGPESGLGAVVGAFPETGVRDPAGAVIRPISDAAFWANEKVINDPLATLMNLGSLAQSEGGAGAFFSPDAWKEAYELTNTRSLGQSVALAFGTKDILDPAQVEKFEGTDLFQIVSGSLDFYKQVFRGDPTFVVGKGLAGVRQGASVRPITEQADIARALNAPRWGDWLARKGVFTESSFSKVDDWIETLPSDPAVRAQAIERRIRGVRGAEDADLVSHFLGQARSRAERRDLWRVFMGENKAMSSLKVSNDLLEAELSGLLRRRAVTMPFNDGYDHANTLFEFLNDAEEVPRIARQIEDVETLLGRQNALADLAGAVRQEARLTVPGAVREAVAASEFWQKSTFAKPVRVFTDMEPRNVLDLHDSRAHVQAQRVLRQAGFDLEDAARLTGEFVAMPRGESRLVAWDKIEREALGKLADKHGLTRAEADGLWEKAQRGRTTAKDQLRQTKYDGNSRDVLQFETDGEFVSMPMLASQNPNRVPIPNIRELDRALGQIGQFKARHKVAGATLDMPPAFLTSVMRVWKPAVLLRPAWPIRVVFDEQLRFLTKFGGLADGLEGFGKGIHNLAARTAEEWGIQHLANSRTKGALFGGAAGFVAAGPVGAAAGAALGPLLLGKLANMKAKGFGQFAVDGVDIENAFGAAADQQSYWRALASSEESFRTFSGQHDRGIFAKAKQDRGKWISVAPGEPSHLPAWADALNLQIGQDALGIKVLEALRDGTPSEKIVDWMKTSREGRAYARRLPWRRDDPEHWVRQVVEQVESYTAGDVRLIEGALRRSVDDDLLRAVDPGSRPVVHGPDLEQAFGKHWIQRETAGLVERVFRTLGTFPTDELSRNRTFAAFYRVEMQRRVRLFGRGAALDKATLDRAENGARRYALNETRKLQYELAERSEFAAMTANLMPFYSAWQEVLTRWAGLAIEDPSVIRRFQLATEAVEQVPESDVGERQHLISRVTDQEGGSFLRIRVPSFAAGIINASPLVGGALEKGGTIRLDPTSINMVTQGGPGFGPIVQVAVSEVAKARPSLEDSLKLIIPFGTSGLLESFLPTAAQRARSVIRQEEDEAFAFNYVRIVQSRMTDMQLGRRPVVDMRDQAARDEFLDDAKRDARAMASLRTVAALVSPVAVQFETPYQPYIDEYRRMLSEDTEGADERFLDVFGDEFFYLVQSSSRSNDGIPPTLEGLGSRDRFRVLIEKFPELGRFVAGVDGRGLTHEFSRIAYDRQLAEVVRPGSDVRQRERLTPEGFLESADTTQGWRKYTRMMDALDAERIRRGLPHLDVKGAEDLKDLKVRAVQAIAGQHREWWDAFSVQDANKWDRKIEGFTAFVSTPGLKDAPGMDTLATYLKLRERFLVELKGRKTKGLRTKANADLAGLWDAAAQMLVDGDPIFAETFYRYLENDPVTAPRLREEP